MNRAIRKAILHDAGVIAAPFDPLSCRGSAGDPIFGAHATNAHPGEQNVAACADRAIESYPAGLRPAQRFAEHQSIAGAVLDGERRLGAIVENARVGVQIDPRTVAG